MTSFIHPQAICETKQIGAKTRVWAFAHILPAAKIGENCNICDHVFIENDVCVGDRVTVKCGVQLWDGLRIEDDVFIGPNVTFCNDKYPRSKQYPARFLQTVIRQGASLGGGAVILPGITVGRNAMIGAGTVVTRDVPPYAKVAGNPGKIIGYTNVADSELIVNPTPTEEAKELRVNGTRFYKMPRIKDLRGDLSAGEFGDQLPFVPKRYFLVFDVPSHKIRGEHAHKNCRQFLLCVKGSCRVLVDDGENRQEILLDRPEYGIDISPLVWGVQYDYSSDAVLLVFASEHYDNEDYIRDYDTFLQIVKQKQESNNT